MAFITVGIIYHSHSLSRTMCMDSMRCSVCIGPLCVYVCAKCVCVNYRWLMLVGSRCTVIVWQRRVELLRWNADEYFRYSLVVL